jgi:hypothetical protein
VILATLCVILTVTAGLLLPTATVTLTPVVVPVSAELTYGVAQSDRTFDITIVPEPVTTTLTYSGSIATTGERFEADGTAMGGVVLTNASTSELLVRAGTTLLSTAGMSYTMTRDVLVPAADPYGSQSFGSTVVEVVATVAGIDGNADAETIVGQLANGVFYTNHEPVGGGTIKRIQVATQADIDALRAQAHADLDARVPTALASLLAPGQQLLAGSEQRGTPSLQLDHQAGEDAANVAITATLNVSASVFSFAGVLEQAQTAVLERLRGLVDRDAELLPDTVSVGEPAPLDGTAGTAFSIRAVGRTQAILSQTELEELAGNLSGKSSSEAMERIRQIAGVDAATIETANDWLWSRLPRLTSRITIEVTDAKAVSPQTTSPGP